MKKNLRMMAGFGLCALRTVCAEPYPPEIMAWTETDRQAQIAAGAAQYTAIIAAYNAGEPSYTVPPGDYRWGVGGRTRYTLSGLTNFTISAYGATFWVDTDESGTARGGFTFNHCFNVTLEGVTVDCHPLPFTQGRISGWDASAKTLDAELDDGYPTLLDQGVSETGRIGFFSEDGELWLNNRTDSATNITLIADRTLRLQMAAGRNFLPDENLHVGKRIALLRENGSRPFVTDKGCKKITFKEVTCYTSAGIVFGGQGEDLVIDGARCIRRPGTDRLLGFVTTGHHSSLRNGVHLKDSEFSYSMDDFMNMDTAANYVFRKEAGNTLLLFNRNSGLLDGSPPFDPGDTLLFYTYNTFHAAGEAQVVSVEPIPDEALLAEARAFPNQTAAAYGNPSRDFPNGGLWRVVLDTAVAADPPAWCYSTAYACEGAVFENCRFFNGSQTAGRVLLSNHSIVRNCTFENIRSVAIQAGWNQASMNGPVIHNLRIESNTFYNCGYHLRGLESNVEAFGTVTIANLFFSELSYATEAHSITIRGNTFIDSAMSAIQINNARDCVIEGNTLIRPGARQPLGAGTKYGNPNAAYGIFLHAVTNSVVTNNVMQDFTEYTKGFIGVSAYTPLDGNRLHIDGFGPLTASPSAVIQSPSAGSSVKKQTPLTIRVNAGDADGDAVRAELLLNGDPIGENTFAPFHFELDTTGLEPGDYTLQIRVTDNDNRVSLSEEIPFRITIGGPGFFFILTGRTEKSQNGTAASEYGYP